MQGGRNQQMQEVLDLLGSAAHLSEPEPEPEPGSGSGPEPEPEPEPELESEPRWAATAPLPTVLSGKFSIPAKKGSALDALSVLQTPPARASPTQPTMSAESFYSAKINRQPHRSSGLCGSSSRGARRLSAHNEDRMEGLSEAARHIAKGDFMMYHKSGGKRKPKKRFFWFDHAAGFIHWSKYDSRQYADHKYKTGKVTAVLAGVAGTVAMRDKYVEADQSLRIETVGYSTLHLRAENSKVARKWVHGLAETLRDALREAALLSSSQLHDLSCTSLFY